MQVVEQRPPLRVVVELGVGEADQAAVLGEDRATAGIWFPQPVGPHRQAVRDDVTIEKGVGIGAPVVTAPAVGVQIRYGLGIGGAGEAELWLLGVRDGILRHRSWHSVTDRVAL